MLCNRPISINEVDKHPYKNAAIIGMMDLVPALLASYWRYSLGSTELQSGRSNLFLFSIVA